MKNALIKDIIREIKHTKSRFFSIFAIIALGTGFFAGLKATCPDMLATQEQYFHDNNLMDIRLVSTYGFDEGDLDAIRDIEGIRGIYPTYSKDAFVETEDNSALIAKVMALPDVTTAPFADKTINTPVLVKGRLPQSANECVVEQHAQLRTVFEIGDTVTVYTTDAEDPISDSLVRNSWTVVGVVMTPQYISYERGNTTIGNGSVDTYIMIPEGNFCYEVYTDVYLTMENTAELEAFGDEYKQVTDGNVELFEAVAEVRKEERFAEIIADADEELAKAKKELEDGEREAEERLAEAKQQLDDGAAQMADGERQLKDGWKQYYAGLDEYNSGKAELDKQIAEAEKQLADAQKQIDEGYAQYQKGVDTFVDELKSSVRDILDKYSEEELRTKIEEIKNAIEAGEGSDEMQRLLEELEAELKAIENLPEKIEQAVEGVTYLKEAKEQLDAAAAQLKESLIWFNYEKEQGAKQLAEAKAELQKGYAELKKNQSDFDKAKAEYEDGVARYEKAKQEAESELADARQQLLDAEKEVAKLKKPVWYVFTREDNPGFSTYKSDAYRIESVCKIFPVFFFLVAILVCLTTMTRMVEEQRTQIGTLKALGYSKGAIASKFIIYSSCASLSGAVSGIAFGSVVFPVVIYSAYEMMYKTPPVKLVPMPLMWVLITLCALVCTTAAALMACMSELRSQPAELMRPKAPKAGKRVLLERVGFIWKRLSFTKKVTVRNLFRYKKRIFMTVLGIAGCTALTMAGFGIYSSISVIIEKQYDEIFSYDLITVLDTDSGDYTLAGVRDVLEDEPFLDENVEIYMKSLSYKGISDVSLVVPKDTERFYDVVKLKDRTKNKSYTLSEEGVVITERFAELSGLSAGDELVFDCDGFRFNTKVTAVAENYTLHFVYMSKSLYESLCEASPDYNMYFSVMSSDDEATRQDLAERLISVDGIQALSFVTDTRESFAGTVANLNYVVILIIVSAAALAFVVLYNLTNINITERVREIATIKVLGFYDGEVSAYVFRENVLLAIIGDGAGLLLGIWLHKFVMQVAQTDSVMFGQDLPLWCFAAAFVTTLAFAFLVNFLMFFRLKKVSMVESLKSVE